MESYPYLTSDCLIHIFTFFNEEDLMIASSVCKEWHEAAETPWLWRKMCLQRWGFCNLAVLGCEHGKPPWKRYYLRRSHLEVKMTKGRAGGDFTCKSLRGHTGRVMGVVYLEGNAPQDFWSHTATVCSASTDGTVRAWDVQKGVQLWCSPVQSPLTGIIRDRWHGTVITADSTGLIKIWRGQTGEEVASFPAASPQCTLLQYDIDNNSFLSVGTSQGSVHTLSGPSLTKTSSLVVCDSFKVNILQVSPDRNWILAGTKEDHYFSPKIIWAQSLTSPSEEEEPLCQSLPISGCQASVFIPTQPARLATIHHKDRSNKALTVLDVSMKKTKYKSEIQVQQVESFNLALNSRAADILLEAKDSSTLVVAADRELWVYSLKGALLASFKDHTEPITSMCVDNFRVVTASQDLSLRVLTWRTDGDKGLTLESRYHLLGGSRSMSSRVVTLSPLLMACPTAYVMCYRGFTCVVCDYSSIVGSVEGKDGKDVLKAYSFNS